MTTEDPPRAKPEGRLASALTRLFTRSAAVREVSELDARFRLVTLSGEALRGVRWTPGQKLQVSLGGWVYRTYTPLGWDASAGSTRLLLFLHGEAPGAAWGRSLKVGDRCALFGPRDSLEVEPLARPTLLFGDETSIGLAYAAGAASAGAQGLRVVLEVSSKAVTERILAELGVANAALVERTPGDAHWGELTALVLEQLQAHSIASCVLSGKASSIQTLSKRLRSAGLSRRQIRTKAYWAPGKVGLD